MIFFCTSEWPQMSQADRIAAMEKFVVMLKESRAAIVDVLMWEICKTAADAAKEFDRTMECKSFKRVKHVWC